MARSARYDEAKARHTLEGVARAAGVAIHQDGERLKILCPVHEEKTPSCILTDGGKHAKKWHCYGCGGGGDVVDLYAALHQVSRIDALMALTDGNMGQIRDTNLPQSTPDLAQNAPRFAPETTQAPKVTQYDAVDLAAAYSGFIALCRTVTPAKDREALAVYLAGRGLTPETVQAGELVAGSWEAFGMALAAHGPDVMRALGLADEYGRYAFRNHPLLMPIRGRDGYIVTLQGRTLGDVEGVHKYQYAAGRERDVWGLNVLRTQRPGTKVFVTEGIIDALTIMQLGDVAIALPSANYHPSRLAQYLTGYRVCVATDTDTTGEAAAVAILEALAAGGISAQRVKAKGGKDANAAMVAKLRANPLHSLINGNEALKQMVKHFDLKPL